MIIESLLNFNKEFFQFWGYVVVFFIIVLDAFPLIGVFFPVGTLMLIISGIFVRLGYFSLWKIILVCFTASFLIDTVGYYWGRRVKKDFYHNTLKKFFIKKSLLEKVGGIVNGHTGKALIFGRLSAITRALGPFVVGTEKVGQAKFFFYNLIGGVLWVTLGIFVGYLFGGSLATLEAVEKKILIITTCIIVGFFIYYLYDNFRTKDETKCKVTEDGLNCKE
ncbi:MAG: DedA family protein [archaeon]